MASAARDNRNVEVAALPAVLSRPEQGKRYGAIMRVRHAHIRERPGKTDVGCILAADGLPSVDAPKYTEATLGDHPQRRPSPDLLQRAAQLVDLRIAAMPVFPGITIFDH